MLGQSLQYKGKPYTRTTLYQHKINFKSLKLSDLVEKSDHMYFQKSVALISLLENQIGNMYIFQKYFLNAAENKQVKSFNLIRIRSNLILFKPKRKANI